MDVRFVFGLRRFDHIPNHVLEFIGVPFKMYVLLFFIRLYWNEDYITEFSKGVAS